MTKKIYTIQTHTADPQMEALLNMTNNVISKIIQLHKEDVPMTLQDVADPQIDRLLRMTNYVVGNIAQQLKETY